MDEDFPLDEDFDEEDEEFPGEADPNEMIRITPENFELVVDSLHQEFPVLERAFFEGLAKSLLNQEMLFADLMSKIEAGVEEEIDRNMQQMSKDGDVEMGIDETTGSVVYWLTPQGEQKAKELERLIIKKIKEEFPGLADDEDNQDDPKEE